MKKTANRISAAEKHAVPHFVRKVRFTTGDLYLFHRTVPACPSCSSLWGMFDKRVGTTLYLESSSSDLIHFRGWHRLPDGFRYCRRASRSELRDYAGNLSWSESCRCGPPEAVSIR